MFYIVTSTTEIDREWSSTQLGPERSSIVFMFQLKTARAWVAVRRLPAAGVAEVVPVCADCGPVGKVRRVPLIGIRRSQPGKQAAREAERHRRNAHAPRRR